MSNTNCLEGIKCPHCGNEHRFFIRAAVTAEVTDEGADIAPAGRGDIEWDDESGIQCPTCEKTGTVGEFSSKEAA
jgi:DNA-directed RNA polymerase subunit RPC12/RpoP